MSAVRAVETLADAQALREIRNECREYMTGSTSTVTWREQEDFFYGQILPGRVRALVFSEQEGSPAVAYALLRPDLNKRLGYVSAGVTAPMRGKGYGRIAIQTITMFSHGLFKHAVCEIRCDNAASLRTCFKIGYRQTASYELNGIMVARLEYL